MASTKRCRMIALSSFPLDEANEGWNRSRVPCAAVQLPQGQLTSPLSGHVSTAENLRAPCSYLKENFPDGLDGEGIMARIREIVVLVFMSVWKKLNPLRERNTFEVFGWDFLLDEDMNVSPPWP